MGSYGDGRRTSDCGRCGNGALCLGRGSSLEGGCDLKLSRNGRSWCECGRVLLKAGGCGCGGPS